MGVKSCSSGEKKLKKSVKKTFLPRRLYTLYEKKFSYVRPFLSIFFPKDFKIFKSLDIGLWEVGEKRLLNGLESVVDRQTYTHFNLYKESAQRAGSLKI